MGMFQRFSALAKSINLSRGKLGLKSSINPQTNAKTKKSARTKLAI
jgi:hypothetical protein